MSHVKVFYLKGKRLTKILLTSRKGLIAYIAANLLWTLPWVIQFAIGYIFNIEALYASGAATLAIMSVPFPIPMWIIVPLTALGIYKII